jgi:hypothetical protein
MTVRRNATVFHHRHQVLRQQVDIRQESQIRDMMTRHPRGTIGAGVPDAAASIIIVTTGPDVLVRATTAIQMTVVPREILDPISAAGAPKEGAEMMMRDAEMTTKGVEMKARTEEAAVVVGRKQLGLLMKRVGLRGIGIEIGTERGVVVENVTVGEIGTEVKIGMGRMERMGRLSEG